MLNLKTPPRPVGQLKPFGLETPRLLHSSSIIIAGATAPAQPDRHLIKDVVLELGCIEWDETSHKYSAIVFKVPLAVG